MIRSRRSRRVVVALLVGVGVLVAGCDLGPRSRDTFGEVPELSRVVAVDAAGDHSLALTADGRVLAWGDTSGGRGGPAPEDDCSARSPAGAAPCRPTPAVVPLPSRATAIASSGDHQAALTADGAVWTWGSDHDPADRRGPTESCDRPSGLPYPCHRTPVRVGGLPPAVAVATGLDHTVAIDRDGRVWQWGEVPPYLATARCSGEPSSSREYTCAPDPVVVPGLPPVTAVSAHGSTSTLAVDAAGGLWGWSGARPTREFGSTATPTRAALPVEVAEVGMGRNGTALVARDGSVWVTGQLEGLATDDCGPGCALTPVQELPAGSATATMGPGGLRVRAPDGRVLVRDREGGRPSTERPSAGWVADPELSGVAMVANGDQHVLVLVPSGGVLAKGYNASGQLGV